MKHVKFATDANYYPFEYFSSTKEIKGFDIDIAQAICYEMNITCTVEHHHFDGLLLTLRFKRYDAVIAALDITSKRLKQVDFSESYYKTAPVFISQQQDQALSLTGKFIGVQANSSNHNYLIRYNKNNSYIVPYFSSSEALADLQQKKIDVVFSDFAVADDFLKKQNTPQEFIISHTEEVFIDSFSQGYGIAVRKGNDELRELINEGLQTIIENGTYDQIYQQYFSQHY